MKNLKRTLCLFLTLSMFITAFPAAAVESVGAGSGATNVPGSGSGGTGSPWSSATSGQGAGLLLHVQSTGLSISNVGGTEEKELIRRQSFADTLSYWTSHFPNTDPNAGQTGMYILPRSGHYGSGYQQAAIQHKTSASGIKYSYSILTDSYYMYTGSDEVFNWWGYNAWLEALSRKESSPANPSYSLPSNYWYKQITTPTKSSAVGVVVPLFSAQDVNYGYKNASDVDKINARIDYYLGRTDAGSQENYNWVTRRGKWGEKDEEFSVTSFLSYCGLIAVVIACLPDAERNTLAKQLDTMCQNFLNGKDYELMFVTGEAVISTEYNNDKSMSCWWTPQQCLKAVTGVDYNDDLRGYSGIDVTSETINVIAQIGKRTVTSGQISDGNGGLTMYGEPSSSSDEWWTPYELDKGSLPVLGTFIKSVSDASLGQFIDYGAEGTGIPGFGVWGLSSPYKPPTTDHLPIEEWDDDEILESVPGTVLTTTTSRVEYGATTAGTIGIQPDTWVVQKDPEVGYSEPVTLTLSLDLGYSAGKAIDRRSTTTTTTAGSVVVHKSYLYKYWEWSDALSDYALTHWEEKFWDEDGGTIGESSSNTVEDPPRITDTNGFASLLKSLVSIQDDVQAAGGTLPKPYIEIWIAQAEPLDTITTEGVNNLIYRTNGYHGTGTEASSTYAFDSIVAAEEENALSPDFKWSYIDLSSVSNCQGINIPGVSISSDTPAAGYGLILTVDDIAKAVEYFEKNDDSLSIRFDATLAGLLEDYDTVDKHLFKVGATVYLAYPQDSDHMTTYVRANTNVCCYSKYTCITVTSTPEPDVAEYNSTYVNAYSELKQGYIPETGTSSVEYFNSMTGTPTFTDTSANTALAGSGYVGRGNYYQYFASGGSEFVVQFKAEYVENQTATRTFKWNFTSVDCGSNTGDHGNTSCGSHSTTGGENPQPIPCTSECAHCGNPVHDKRHRHYMAGSASLTLTYTGLCYMKITECKVWKLSEAKLDGTRDLLDTDEVTATVQATAPNIFYNRASSNTSAAGRIVYAFAPEQNDTVTFTHALSAGCGTDGSQIQQFIQSDLAGATLGATCISDCLVLRTSNGDQSILYYEYKSDNFDTPILSSVTGISGGVAVGTTNGSATITPTQSTVTFAHKTFDDMWTNNKMSAEGCGLPDDGITYGGYNGNYSSPATKYASSGHPSNISLEQTTAYQNKSGAFSGTKWGKPTQKLRLVNHYLVIPDSKENGEYLVGESYVFYANILNYGEEEPLHSVSTDDRFNAKGFSLRTTYSPEHDKINDVVVYNPVSNQNAFILSLDSERDQRVRASSTASSYFSGLGGCPGDETCDFLVNECTVTQHVHDESCYTPLSYMVHGPNNAHEHTDDCYTETDPVTTEVVLGSSTVWHADVEVASVPYDGTLKIAVEGFVGIRPRLYLNGTLAYLGTGTASYSTVTYSVPVSAGDAVRLTWLGDILTLEATLSLVYEDSPTTLTCNSLPLNKHVCDENCYTMHKAMLSCSDPHHTYSYNWKLYTYGLQHTSGTICSGRSCTDTSALIFPTQVQYTTSQCAAGSIVRHANGDVHLTTATNGVCTYCGKSYKEVLSKAQATDRTPNADEWSCYGYGDSRCWRACNDDSKHDVYVSEITLNGTSYSAGDFINLDYGFTLYFPNTGDFYGTGAAWSSVTSPERGKGYTDNMDTTLWISAKWVEFPFDVVYNNATYLAYERIYLTTWQSLFDFYLPLENNEMAYAEIRFGTVAINAQNGETLECAANASHNIKTITYNGRGMSHHHNADKRAYIDVVGRVGNLTMEDTGDLRWCNFFKVSTSDWMVNQIIHKVNVEQQNNLLVDRYDIRGIHVAKTGVGADTYGTKNEKSNVNKLWGFPLRPYINNVSALQRQPIRIGYSALMDVSTLGNYYGTSVTNDAGETSYDSLVFIIPHYYRLDLNSGEVKAVDVYMEVDGSKVLINDNDSRTVSYSGLDSKVSLDWTKEKLRRNYSGLEATYSEAVVSAYTSLKLPAGSSWTYGNYNILNLTERTRTFIGSETTYNMDTDPSDRLFDLRSALQAQRWHFSMGLPSSAVFVYSGKTPTDANIEACTSGSAVILCALEIYAQGQVWTLAYDGSNLNVPFQVVPNGPTYDPVIKYPNTTTSKDYEMPIVEIISINHSSKEDLTVSGTH